MTTYMTRRTLLAAARNLERTNDAVECASSRTFDHRVEVALAAAKNLAMIATRRRSDIQDAIAKLEDELHEAEQLLEKAQSDIGRSEAATRL